MRPIDNFERGRLAANARAYKYDPALDPIADAMDCGDAEKWQRLPARLIGLASTYRDFRASYRAAVEAGVVPDDRGPSAA